MNIKPIRLRNRDAARLLVTPPEFPTAIAAYRQGNVSARSVLTFVGDLTNPTYSIVAIMGKTVSDDYVSIAMGVEGPIQLVETPLSVLTLLSVIYFAAGVWVFQKK